MKKWLLIILTIFLLIFLVLSIRNRSSDMESDHDQVSIQKSEEQDRIREFWDQMRSATDARIKGDWKKAAGHYERALTINPVHEDALYYLGNMYYDLGLESMAKESWSHLVGISRHNTKGFFQLGSLYMQSDTFFDIEAAEQMFLKAKKINKEETGALLRLGQVYLVKGDLEKALEYFSSVTASNFRNAEAYFLSGYIHAKQSDQVNARAQFSSAVDNVKPFKRLDPVVGEGDTKQDPAILSRQRSLFSGAMKGLENCTLEQMDAEREERFRRVDSILMVLRKKIR